MIKNFVNILELLGDRLEVCVSVCIKMSYECRTALTHSHVLRESGPEDKLFYMLNLYN